MITLSADQVAKIEILDKLFSNLDLNQLQQFAESELVVAKLKGGDDHSMILINLLREHDTLCVDVIDMKNELSSLRADFQALVKAINQQLYSPKYDNEFTSLKSKYSIY